MWAEILLTDNPWIAIKDGDDRGRAMYKRHYSSRRYRDGRKPKCYIGPGEKMVLLTLDCKAVFVWRKFISRDNQEGVNCAVFRNEGYQGMVSSELIRHACTLAWQRWPGERLYTYVNDSKVKSPNPGYCFLCAGWRKCGRNKNGRLTILEVFP